MSGVSPVDWSNRGKSFTILAMCTIVHALCKFYNIGEGSVTLHYDNKEVLKRKQP